MSDREEGRGRMSPQGREEPPPRPDDGADDDPDNDADDDRVKRASEESFPASDAPSWAPLHPGPPGEHPDRLRSRRRE